ncbi:unnamed protein product [Plutella xylostella]|uniref:(diamondback moth) hypothetical protein n=1 Tax=Plutella xylostella TaxID=51655 RepID=A0A8S4DI39_PLUXY|nr:unnamed protein product [Plutella xylostella]
MRILLSELGLSGACLGLTLDASSLDDKPAPGQRPQTTTVSTSIRGAALQAPLVHKQSTDPVQFRLTGPLA